MEVTSSPTGQELPTQISRRHDRGSAGLIHHSGRLPGLWAGESASISDSLPPGRGMSEHPVHMAASFSPPSTGEPEDPLRQLKRTPITIQASRERKAPLPVEANDPVPGPEHILITEVITMIRSNSCHREYPSVSSAWSLYSASNRARENHSSNSHLSCPSFSCFSKTGRKDDLGDFVRQRLSLLYLPSE